MGDYKKIVVFENAIEAQLLAALLEERKIPHLVRSFHDSAMNGLYQMGRGWGRLEAPPEYEEEIMLLFESIREQADDLDEEEA